MEAMEVVERRRNFENKPILKANAQKNHSPSFLRLFRANRVSPSLGSELSSRVEKNDELPVCEVKQGRIRKYKRGKSGQLYLAHEERRSETKGQSSKLVNGFFPRVQGVFLPDKHNVTREYWSYAKWRFVQRIASSAIGVLGTQQLLFAIGIGAQRALPTAAVLNWVVKDGLGRLGKLCTTAFYGDRIDADVKRFRFGSSIIYTLSHGIEIVTPLMPGQFLILATLANIGKSIGITAGNVSRVPIQMSFALGDNVAEIAARTSAQQVVADNIGLGLAVLATWTTRHRPLLQKSLPFILYPFLAAVDLGGIHKELESVILRGLNKERAQILTKSWLENKTLPSPHEVAREEHFLLPRAYHGSILPLNLVPLHKVAPDVSALQELTDVYGQREEISGRYLLRWKLEGQTSYQYILNMFRLATKGQTPPLTGSIDVALHEKATAQEQLLAMLQAEQLRIWMAKSREELLIGESLKEALHASQSLGSSSALRESLDRALRERKAFIDAAAQKGWNVGSVFIDGPHTPKYSFLVDGHLR